MDRVGLSSVFCPLLFDIVKRVVTVKQVRPSPLRRGEVGPGAWVCVLPVREHRQGAAVCAAVPENRSRSAEHSEEAGTCGILVCPLISVL